MPIYEYRCESCGHQQEALQKVSDAPLKVCAKCGKPTLSKMVTAAGFQLKGSGWYATDFKGGAKSAKPGEEKDVGGPKVDSKSGDEGKTSGGDKAKGDNKPKEEAKSDASASSVGASAAGQ